MMMAVSYHQMIGEVKLHLEQLGMFNSPPPKSREIGELTVVRRKIARLFQMDNEP